ncbi:MAG: PAS domain-containing protein [Candidatus Wildermuthbacteria bacterium]|nr:PAS domain-containing protein [Candidatus Wildermuthbacteria bacterium]
MASPVKQKRENLLIKKIAEMVLESIFDWIVVVDHRTHEWVYSNPACKRIVGYEVEEILGQDTIATSLLPSETKALIASQWKKLEKEGFIHDIEVEAYAKNGEKVPLNLSEGVIKNAKGEVVYRVVIARDLREIKGLTHDLQASKQKLEERLEELEIFQKVAVQRELKIAELKEKIRALEEQLQNK